MHFIWSSIVALGVIGGAASVSASEASSSGYQFNGMAGDVTRRAYPQEQRQQELEARERVVGLSSRRIQEVNGQIVGEEQAQQALWPRERVVGVSTTQIKTVNGQVVSQMHAEAITPSTPSSAGTSSGAQKAVTPSQSASGAATGPYPPGLNKVLNKVASDSLTKHSWEHAVCYHNGAASRYIFHKGDLVHNQNMSHAKLRKGGSRKGKSDLSIRADAGTAAPAAGDATTPTTPATPSTPTTPATPSTPTTPATPSTPTTPVTSNTPTTPATPNTPTGAAGGSTGGKGGKKDKTQRPVCITWRLDRETAKLMAAHFDSGSTAGGAKDPAATTSSAPAASAAPTSS
ncbi:hypothetical protein K437DRAFT_292616 [Tilletiaria anomala UBC 951]|uniref:Uncharacterized protein n=1 Tax=Tilletiaria anomala (strain ATCC 24038 / CBS 436.72 / UBC 951) TaxID=1037660 RepID=A0A066WPL7_TILAU|nr:uncharacterized protein K437DRAFT_292616 [Tilletiaria anomala UBC 951]KDN52929.1 hypothetical protein K437DRAFT_292616 [Tilletiaria anomala UBC 951]